MGKVSNLHMCYLYVLYVNYLKIAISLYQSAAVQPLSCSLLEQTFMCKKKQAAFSFLYVFIVYH